MIMTALTSRSCAPDWTPPGSASPGLSPPTLAVFTTSYPPPSSSGSSSSNNNNTQPFVLPPTTSLAARRQHKRSGALGGSAPKFRPPTLDLSRGPTLEDEIALLPDLLARLSLKRKSAPAALSSMNMTLAGRKKARYLIVVNDEDDGGGDDDSPKGSPMTPNHNNIFRVPPTPLFQLPAPSPPPQRRRRIGPKKRVRWADEVEVEIEAERENEKESKPE